MARKKIDFTLEQVLEDVIGITDSFDEEIRQGFGENFCLAVLDESNNSYNKVTVEDIKNSILAHDVAYAYTYVVNAAGDSCGCLDGLYQFHNVIQGLIGEDSKFKFLYDLASARGKLDCRDNLNLKELALLAGVDERTVRNAASSKDENSLQTTKSGGGTIVEYSEAERWLKNRPDFKFTRDISDVICFNATDFGNFVLKHRESLNLTIDDVANSIGVDTNVLRDLENGIDHLHLTHVSKLEKVLEIEDNLLLTNYMMIFHENEFKSLATNSNRPLTMKLLKNVW
jgi:ribosome-binding protein aMBF1 (putative translation factor)